MTIVHPLDPTAIRLQSGGHEPNTDQESAHELVGRMIRAEAKA